MPNLYQVDPALHLFVDAIIGNGHTGFVKVADPPSESGKERLSRDLGRAGDLINTSLAVVARVVVKNAKDAVLSVEVYQKDAAGTRTNPRSFKDDLPSAGPSKRKNLSVDVEIF
jgi:hypothetical protein